MPVISHSDKVEDIVKLIHPECAKRSGQAQDISGIVDAKHSNKSIKDRKYFLFDIIVVRLDIPNKTIDQSTNLLVYANFNGKNFRISSNRINVLDFTTENSLEFDANPLELKEQLSVNPLTLKVTDSKRVLGYGTLKWPTEFLSDVEKCAGEITKSFEIELMKCDGTRTGTTQIMVRLQIKCEEYEEDNSLCRNAYKEIEPNDVLFVVGEETGKTCCCSQIGIIPATDSDHELQPKCLDLSNFRAVNSQNVNNMDIFATEDPACQKIEVEKDHYRTLLHALKSTKNEYPLVETSHCKRGETLYTLASDNCLKINVIPSSSDSHQTPAPCLPDNRGFAAKNIKKVCYKESVINLMSNEPRSFRSCPLCKENMNHLPKLATCPNCCYKPLPYFEENPYDDSRNADQILKEFHDKLQKSDNSLADTNSKEQKCRCICKSGSNKPCAHCRIRKLCENIFKPPLNTPKPDDVCEPKFSEIHCVSSSDNRPFLTRIFSELKDLYDTEETKKKELEVDARCENKLNKNPVSVKQNTIEKETESNVQTAEVNELIKPQETKKQKKCLIKAASKKLVRSKLYDYQIARQSFTYKCEHKTCINDFAGYRNVPPNMGWLWNVHRSEKWKPGTISKPIQELMRYFLRDFPADTLLVSQYSYRKHTKSKSINDSGNKLVQKPTLHVRKKNGEYIITMRPLKPLEHLKDSADPYENMKPIQFRIVKNPQLQVLRNLKSCLKSMGFRKCTCHRPITYCYCRGFLDKKRLEYLCRKECSRRQIKSCCDTLILSDTSESEDEFDFAVTPPVGVVRPEKLKKINVVNVSTQYNELDWNPVPLFPRPANKYMQMYQCAVTERKAVAENSEGAAIKDAYSALRRGTYPKGGVGNVSEIAGKAVVAGRNFGSARGGGDGLYMQTRSAKEGASPKEFSNKYGGLGDPVSNKGFKKGENAPKKKVDMLKYVLKMNKKMTKLSPDEAILKRKEKMNLLKGANPPLLCMVDRRGKPVDPCAPCFPCGDHRIC